MSLLPRMSLSRMTLRARTLAVGCLLTGALVIVGASVPVPYVGLGPGVTYNTIGQAQGADVITFSGPGIPASVNQPPVGHLNMTTITVVDKIPLYEAVGMWASGRYLMAPREEYYPPNKSEQQVNQENVQMFQDSQTYAEIAALRYLDYPNVVYVGDIPEGSPSAAVLQPQDRIAGVDGTKVTDYASLKAVMATTHPGQQVHLVVLREEKSVAAEVTLGANAQVGPQGFLGVGVVERPLAPFTISIPLQDIGGPSAGLMFTLGIIDKLTPGDLSGGKFIAGTGTMDLDGNVGPIGGILLKEITVRSAGADVFLVPAANCSEALTHIPAGLQLVKVSTLDDAMTALHTLAAGGTPPGC